MRMCGRCHECGAYLRSVLDGEEWCAVCQAYRRYESHGWASDAADPGSDVCPEWDQIIVGRRERGERIVMIGDHRLEPHGFHSYEFEWGYGGSGPAELAIAILGAVAPEGKELYQEFKWDVIAKLPFRSWRLPVGYVKRWVAARLAEAVLA